MSFDYEGLFVVVLSTINVGLDFPVPGAMEAFSLNSNFALYTTSGNAVVLVDMVATTKVMKSADLSVGVTLFAMGIKGLKSVPGTNFIITKGGMVVISLLATGLGSITKEI
jgi:hypothetical protein